MNSYYFFDPNRVIGKPLHSEPVLQCVPVFKDDPSDYVQEIRDKAMEQFNQPYRRYALLDLSVLSEKKHTVVDIPPDHTCVLIYTDLCPNAKPWIPKPRLLKK